MTSITTRAGKGSPLTHNEVDANFTNLNNDKLDTAGIALGSAASPTLKFTGDPNTGIYSPGADQLAVSTGGTERLRITSAGLVGIGTSSPSAKTEIVSSGSESTLILRNASSTVSTYSELKFAPFTGTTAASAAIRVSYTGFNNGPLEFRTTNIAAEPTTRMVIDGVGNVGIGTTSPDGRLHVLQGTTPNIAQLYVGQGGGSNNYYDANNHYFRDGNLNSVISTTSSTIQLFTGAAERARIDSSGRLLIGTSSSRGVASSINGLAQLETSTYLALTAVNNTNDAGGCGIAFAKSRGTAAGGTTIVQSGDDLGTIFFAGADGTDLTSQAASIKATVDGTPGADDMPGRLVFSTTADGSATPTERMRITNGGNVLFNATAVVDQGLVLISYNGGVNQGAIFADADATSGNQAIRFKVSGSTVGSISTTASATAYNTSSDYRLKGNVTAVTDGITRLQQLKPSRFNFIADPDHTVDGFLAHEVQVVVPEAITGEKDAVDDDGNPVYQGIDQSKLVPLLTAALQEAIAKIESLEARLTAAGI